MALPAYPPPAPAPNTNVKTMERGQLNYFFTNLQATSTQPSLAGYGNTLGAPSNINIFGISANRANESSGEDFVVQIDCYGSTAGAGPNATVAIIGSLDGAQFYTLTTIAVTTQGTIVSLAKAITPEFKLRYISAAVTAYAGNGGVIDSLTAGIYA